MPIEGTSMTETTEMLPTLIMLAMHLLAAGGMYFFVEKVGKLEIPFDLVIGFFTTCLLFVLSFNWYAGWPDYYNGAYLTITNYYMAGFTGFVAVIWLILFVYYLYKFLFEESREVTV
jgi:hypothetical protein